MKLNLLPTSVSKGKQTQTAILLSALVAVLSVAGAIGMIITSRAEMQQAAQAAADAKPRAELAAATAKYADEIIAQARVILTNINLADEMSKHSTVYPDLYDEVRRYIPGFYRVTSMSATAGGPATTTLNLNGVLHTYQEYADLMLALYRIPGVQTVARAGYQDTDKYVPQLSPADQFGRPIRPGEQPIPDDPLERLDQMIAQGGVSGFNGTGGFGGPPGPRGAMPSYSTVAVTVVLARGVQTPDPRGTLGSIGSAAPAGATGGFQAPAPTTAGTAGNAAPPQRGANRGGGQAEEGQ